MRRHLPAIIAAIAVLTVVAACSSSSPGVRTEDLATAAGSTVVATDATPPSTNTSPSSPTPVSEGVSAAVDPSSQEAADRAAVEAQWTQFWVVYGELPHTPAAERDALAASVAVDPSRSNLLTDAQTINDKGWDTYGRARHRISWPQPIGGADTAVIADCQDQSQVGSYETSSGHKTTVGVERSSLQGSLVRGDDQIWRVQQVFYLKDEPC